MLSATSTISIPQLRTELRGRVIAPDDAEYDAGAGRSDGSGAR